MRHAAWAPEAVASRLRSFGLLIFGLQIFVVPFGERSCGTQAGWLAGFGLLAVVDRDGCDRVVFDRPPMGGLHRLAITVVANGVEI